ncbi:HAD family hydrolase [Lactiplantibacillus plantarum]|uniref:HAD family hydrolase n=1 Tax=Lactiplantibacillus plantarum TaxID=1590 RepID=UPI000E526E72|nr:HAD family phosphatase [Lactiplantibacillus plantarum]MBE1726596.1 HAD family phosphatase [Lactiplantibacillus plantarum]NKI38567.1 HAD family phosphatase [Lactiplantibacillus plantarum]QDJ17961.1 MFS transporter [Lactiplantibacillus plantarum]RHF44809.1 HAD family phosphatase [Lactiplantibacillus plantarum]
MTKAVIFDLDGLLIDSEVISLKMYQRIVQDYGQTLSMATYAQEYSGKSAVTNMQHLIERFDLPFNVDTGLKRALTLEKTFMQDGVELKPGARVLLQFLHRNHYSVALASSSIKSRALDILTSHDVAQYFDQFTFGPDVDRGKPYPDIFLMACAKLQQQPADCLVLEDSEAGIQAATSAKIPVICVPDMKRPNQPYADQATAIVSSLTDVITHLKSVR